MRANGHVLTGHELPTVSSILHAVKEWASEKITQERIAEGCVVVGTSALCGYLLLVLHLAIQNRTVAGF